MRWLDSDRKSGTFRQPNILSSVSIGPFWDPTQLVPHLPSTRTRKDSHGEEGRDPSWSETLVLGPWVPSLSLFFRDHTKVDDDGFGVDPDVGSGSLLYWRYVCFEGVRHEDVNICTWVVHYPSWSSVFVVSLFFFFRFPFSCEISLTRPIHQNTEFLPF